MDYDDNDFQGHNLQLAGEGSSKLSPVLRDYALPKFDFDDSLQGHLRFDSLVENEVFLGISNQEDNQWIEDFSRGSSGIEFSSSATESCSISRRNNVWSEATSSESVEMLLKSVGQEERILGETIIEESDAGDELGRLTNKMEPNLKQNDKMEDAIHSQPALPPDDFLDGWNESIGAENPIVECTSEAQKDDPPVYKSFGEVESHVYSGVIVSEGNVDSDRKCDDANHMEVDSLAKESLVDVKELPSVSGIHIGNTSSSSHNVIASSVELNDQESIYKVTDVCFENVDGLLKEISEGIEERNVQIKEYDMVGQISSGTVDETCTNIVEDPHSVPSRLESFVEQKVEINITTLEEPSEVPMKGDCDLQIEEGCKNDVSPSEPTQSCNFEVMVCTEGPEICKQHQGSLLEDSPVTCLVDGSPKGQAIEVGNTKVTCPELDISSVEEKGKGFGSDNQMDSLEGKNNEVGDTKGGNSFCQELEIGSVVEKEKEKFHGSDNEMDRRVLTEASVLPGIDHTLIEQGDGSGINHVGDLSSLTVSCSSAKLLTEQSSTQNLSDVNNTPRFHKEEFLPEGHMPLMLGESMQLNKKILSSEQVGGHSCDQDVPFHEKENAKLPPESSDMQCRVVGSLCLDEFSEGNIVTTHGSEFDSSTGNEPESNIVVKDKNLLSCDKLNGLPMSPGTGATADEVTSHNHGQKSTVLGVLSMGTDETEETVIEVHKDASLSGLNKSLQMATDVEPVPEGSVSEDGKASQWDQAAVQECSKKLEVCPDLFDSTVKQVEGTEAAGCENFKEILMQRNAEVALVEVTDAVVLSDKIVAPAEAISASMVESCCQKDHETIVASGTQTTGKIGPSTKVDLSDESQALVALACSSKCVTDCMNEDGDNSDNLVKDNCESPTVISCTELPLSEKGQQGAIKRTTVDSVLHSEATRDTGENVKLASLQTGKDASKEERSFTFEVRLSGLSEGETGKSWQSFPSGQVQKISTNDEGSPLTSDHSQIDVKTVPEISHGNAQASVGVIKHAGVKGTPDRKPRRGSGKAAARENAKKGNHVKETTPLRQSEKVDKAMMVMGSPGTGQIVQFEELKSCGDVERNGTKACGVLPTPTSNLPDLNTSVPPAAFFQQPFTDLQQVQLRAQILVYGSLIQESVPDEACMISAFGPSEGGGSLWEPAWRACIEKVRGQKSHASNSETPVQSRSGSKAPERPVKHSSLQSKVLSSPAGRASSKGIPSPAVNPIIPLSSPLWNVSSPTCDGLQSSSMSRGLLDYQQPLSPLHPYQATGVRNFVGHSPSWLSQTPFPGPWVASPQTSPFDVNARFSVFPNTEPVKLTPTKDPSVPNFPATKHASLPAVANSGGDASVSSGTSSQPDVKKVTVSSSQHSADPKSRKRKKVPASEGLGQIPLPTLSQTASACGPGVGNHLSKRAPVPELAGQMTLLAQSQTDTVPTAIVSNLSSASVAGATPACFVSTSNSGKYLAALSPTSFSDQPRRVGQNVEKKSILSDETLNTVEEAKLQAEAAASHAAAAVGHCHDVWSQLVNQKNSGLASDVEAKLASAAMAIAAAASVAKAAAAVAKIASNVAVQAKLMAEEVSVSNATVNSTRNTGTLCNVPNSSGNATPSSVFKDGDGSVYPSSIIAVAREAARKRVEAASAASKHAENLDAIVKAAELAAEAVSQAGKIVSIGDPLPLSKLVESGPVDYWKSPQGSKKGAQSHTLDSDQPKTVSFEELCNVSTEKSKVGPSVMEEAMKPGTVTSFEKDSFRTQQGHRASNLAKNVVGVPELEVGSRSASVIAEDANTSASGTSIENGMKEGCLVEVFKDGGNCKAAWYSANILNLNDGKAFVCYTELQADEGSGYLKEWVSLEGDGIKAPKIRIAHPATTMRLDGTKKRRRAAMMDYTWSVGDKVDAWMQDCWCEGIVKEKNKNDETTLTIHFPALEDTSAVRAWHLRPTLTWKDGEWIEWSSARQQSPSQGDAPQEKRVKLGSSTMEAKGKDKMSRGVDLVESKKHEESRPLPLSVNEKEFNVGKNTRHENKVDAQRTVRTGLQKEGSRVVFGVPKPGKKRKFMDVSKHFDSDQSSKNINTNDSVKFARYLMPQGSGSRGWKNNSKIDVKERQAADDKTKVLRSGKPPSSSVRAQPQKGNLTSAKSAPAAPHDATTTKDQIPEDVISNEEKSSGQQSLMEFGSFSNSQDTSEGPTLVSSLGLPQVAPKKVFSSNAKSKRLNKGKLAATGGRLNKKVEPQDKLIPEVVEPRRSNRKIQPTSRLLEGLQSSLIISKMPSVPHDKSQRSQNRSNAKGNTNHG